MASQKRPAQTKTRTSLFLYFTCMKNSAIKTAFAKAIVNAATTWMGPSGR